MTGGSVAALLGLMLVLAIVPGPSDVAVVARSLRSGFRQALFMVAGIVVADCLFIAMAIASLTLVAVNAQPLLGWIKYAGAAYLIWLGLASFRPAPAAAPANERLAGASGFAAGLLITLADPKALLFYIGILPAFVEVTQVTPLDVLLFVVVVTLVVGGVKGSYAYLAHAAKRWFDNPRVRHRLEMAGGVLLLGTGLFLLAYR